MIFAGPIDYTKESTRSLRIGAYLLGPSLVIFTLVIMWSQAESYSGSGDWWRMTSFVFHWFVSLLFFRFTKTCHKKLQRRLPPSPSTIASQPPRQNG